MGPESLWGWAVGRGRTPSHGRGLIRGSAGRLVGRPRALRLVVRSELDQRQTARAVGPEVLAGRERESEVSLPERGGQLGDGLDRLVDLLRVVRATGLLDRHLDDLHG